MSTFWKLQPQLRALCIQEQQQQAYRTISTSKASRALLTAAKASFKFPFSALSYHWNTAPPSDSQLRHASKFFNQTAPRFIWSAEKFKTVHFGDCPEVCFLGRSNVGKSSLLNILLGRKIAHTSSKPGRTRLMNAFAVGGQDEHGQNRLVVVDMPGYGKGGRAEWGTEILKYLQKRKELRRAFLLIEAEHGIKDNDRQLLLLLQEHAVPFQVVLAKADKILLPGSRTPSVSSLERRFSTLRERMEAIKESILDLELECGGVGEIIACSSDKRVEGKTMGIDNIRFAILSAAGLEYKETPVAPKDVETVPHEDIVYKN